MTAEAAASRCIKCGSQRIYPSRIRSLFERLRRAITEKQPYRCHACNYRAWSSLRVPAPKGPDKSPDDLRVKTRAPKPVTSDDLDRLDNR